MRPTRLRGPLSSAHVIACVALFIALGSSAAAAVTLAKNSVGSPQIRQDAVRSSEIRADEVRSPEIAGGAVRSSELRDAGVKFTDVSDAARTALRGDLHVAEEKDVERVPECDGVDLRDCPNLLVLPLATGDTSRAAPAPGPGPGQPEPGPGQPEQGPQQAKGSNWLVQARTTLLIQARGGSAEVHCGLVNPNVPGPAAVLDDFRVIEITPFGFHVVTLSGVLKKSAGNQTVALRCTTELGDDVNEVSSTKMTALEVGAVTGP
jgi:hypothetical protein